MAENERGDNELAAEGSGEGPMTAGGQGGDEREIAAAGDAKNGPQAPGQSPERPPEVNVNLFYGILTNAVGDIPARVLVGVPLLFTVVLPLIAASLADLIATRPVLSGGVLIGFVAFLIAAPLVAGATASRRWHLPTVSMALLWTVIAISGAIAVGYRLQQGEEVWLIIGVAVTAILIAVAGVVAFNLIRRLSERRVAPASRDADTRNPASPGPAPAGQRVATTPAYSGFTLCSGLMVCAAAVPLVVLTVPDLWPAGSSYPAQFTRDLSVMQQLRDGIEELDFLGRRLQLERRWGNEVGKVDVAMAESVLDTLRTLEDRVMGRAILSPEEAKKLTHEIVQVTYPFPQRHTTQGPRGSRPSEVGAAADSAAAGRIMEPPAFDRAAIRDRLALTYGVVDWGMRRNWVDAFRSIRLAAVIGIAVAIGVMVFAAWWSTRRLENLAGDKLPHNVRVLVLAIAVEVVIAVPMLRPIRPDEIRLDGLDQAFLQANWFLPRMMTEAVRDAVGAVVPKDTVETRGLDTSDPDTLHLHTVYLRDTTVVQPVTVVVLSDDTARLNQLQRALAALEKKLPWDSTEWKMARDRLRVLGDPQ